MKGAYCLVFVLGRAQTVRIGALGAFDFPSGVYVYVGSAQAGVEQRIGRHLRKGKRKRWHVDYLLEHADVVSTIGIATGMKEDECDIAQTLLRSEGASVVAPGFGSSDCRCSSHLIFYGDDDCQKVIETVAMQLSLLRCVYPEAF